MSDGARMTVDGAGRRRSVAGTIRRALFGIPLAETTFARRGFQPTTSAAQARLEGIGATFVEGYHAALEDDDPHRLADRLNDVAPTLRGFAFEGAGMGLAIADFAAPWRASRWRAFVDGPGDPHRYVVHVGLGWALARLPFGAARTLARVDPLLRWLVLDGYGFHQGYFHAERFITRLETPLAQGGWAQDAYAGRALDQGLGRSLWFALGGDVARVTAQIETFPPDRRADLWSGIGLATAYAGGVDQSGLETLLWAAGRNWTHVVQGTAFAAKAMARAGASPAHTALACDVVCDLSVEAAAGITDDALVDLSADDAVPAYETWRARIRQRFATTAIRASPSLAASARGPELPVL